MDDVQRLEALTERDRRLNSFAFRSFRDVGDGDYIAARLAYRAKLPGQFLWASQQTLEKYLKCILFIRRVAAVGVRHELAEAMTLIKSAGIPLDLTERTERFMAAIDAVGQYRYLEVSFVVPWTQRIVALDQAVWELRRFCTLDPRVTSLRLTEGQWAPRYRIGHGYLEEVLDKRDNPARQPLLWHNGYFGRGRRTVRTHGGLIGVNTPLLWMTEDEIDEVQKYAFIPPRVVKAHRQERQKASSPRSSTTPVR